MPFKKFKKLRLDVSDLENPKDVLRVINSLQTNIEDSIAPLASNIQNDTTILTNVSLVASKVNIINHTLGRKLAGWAVVRKRGFADIKDLQDTNLNPEQTLLLQPSADVVVDLEVF